MMKYVVIAGAIAVILGLLVLALIWWRSRSYTLGAQKRAAEILPLIAPIIDKLDAGQTPTAEQVEQVANISFVRPSLYNILKHFECLDLFPKHLTAPEAQAEAKFVFWMMHPKELQAAPDKIELVEKITRKLNGEPCDFYVFRYRMSTEHWAAKDGWLLGLAGPFIENDVPYSDISSAFSRVSDKYGEVKSKELVDWYIGMATAKGVFR